MASRLKFTFSDTDYILFEWDTTEKCLHIEDESEKKTAGQLEVGNKICIENHLNPARTIATIEEI